MLRIVGGLVLGVVAAMATIFAVEYVGHQVHPIPDGIDTYDPDQMAAYVATAPLGAMLFVVAAWGIGAFVGGVLARLVARRRWSAWVVACVVAFGGIANIFMIPSPLWMQVCAVAVPLVAGFLASRVPLRSDEVHHEAL